MQRSSRWLAKHCRPTVTPIPGQAVIKSHSSFDSVGSGTAKYDYTVYSTYALRSSLLLSRSLGLGGLLSVASDHDHAQEGPNNGGTEENEDDGDTDSPDAGREEVLKRVVVIDKGLGGLSAACAHKQDSDSRGDGPHTMRRVQMV